MKKKTVTLGTIMSHMTNMKEDLIERIDDVKTSLNARINDVNTGLNARMDRMERNLTRQIDGIDKRLDAVEIEQLPRRVRKIEEHLGLVS
jgi:hypothetical protein